MNSDTVRSATMAVASSRNSASAAENAATCSAVISARTESSATKRTKARHQTFAKVTTRTDGFTRADKGRTTQRTKAGEKKVKPKPKNSRQKFLEEVGFIQPGVRVDGQLTAMGQRQRM